MVKGKFLPNFISEGPKVVQNLEKKVLSKNLMRPIKFDQRNVLNAKMYVVGSKINFFKGQKW